MPSETVAVVGGGLVGCLAAIGLQRKGYKVDVFELRDDLRLQGPARNLRSINLAVSDRGIKALNYVDPDMAARVLKDVIPMYGRMIHDLQGNQESQIYGLFGESINSIDRAFLNKELLNELEKSDGITMRFRHKLLRCDWENSDGVAMEFAVDSGESGLQTRQTYDGYAFVIGADGAYSTVRSQLQRVVRMDFQQEYLDHMYLELYVSAGPPDAAGHGTFRIDPNHLHIWPRHEFMLIALANKDGSFTSTFFAPWSLAESLDSAEKAAEFFAEQFPDAVQLIGRDSLMKAWETHPKGSLVCIKCRPYNYKGRGIIIGDAAHSMVPFYGQGMNCGFEDVRILLETLEKHSYNAEEAFNEYTDSRHEDLTTIIDLAMQNYVEMRHSVTDPFYRLRKAVDGVLGRLLKDWWIPMYTMISFRGDIPYSQAVVRQRRQERIFAWGLRAIGLVLAAGVAVQCRKSGILRGLKF